MPIGLRCRAPWVVSASHTKKVTGRGRAAKARCRPSPGRLDKAPPVCSASAARPAGLHRRNFRQDQHDHDLRACDQGPAPERQRTLRQMEHPGPGSARSSLKSSHWHDFRALLTLHRGSDRQRTRRALNHPRRDEQRSLRHLRRDPTRPGPRTGNCRHTGQPQHPQDRPRRTCPPEPRLLVPICATLLPGPEPNPNGLRQTQATPVRRRCQNLRPTPQSPGRHLRPLHSGRMIKLPQACGVCINVNAK
jgi:hypothetical protein